MRSPAAFLCLPVVLAAALSLAGWLPSRALPSAAAQKAPPAPSFAREGVAFPDKPCPACHNAKKKRAGLSLHPYRDEAALLKGRKVFDSVLRMLASGEMPPKERPRPTPAEIE